MLTSVIRGLPRILVLAGLGVLNLLVAHLPDTIGLVGGVMPLLAPICMASGLAFLFVAAGDLCLRILQPRVDAQEMAVHARRSNCTASALVYVGRCILAAAVLLLMATASRAEPPPAAAVQLLPVLQAEQVAHWPRMPQPSALGAQVEQETCPSLKSRSCWSPRAELRTSREQGVGLGQLTRSWDKAGRQRFDALVEVVSAHPRELAGLSWANRYDAALQLRALVLKDRDSFLRVQGAATAADRVAMTLSAYNGGLGGLMSDRRACAATQGCDPTRWFGNVERTSLKAKTAIPGYGKSFFEVNRSYVRNILLVRRGRYAVLGT